MKRRARVSILMSFGQREDEMGDGPNARVSFCENDNEVCDENMGQ